MGNHYSLRECQNILTSLIISRNISSILLTHEDMALLYRLCENVDDIAAHDRYSQPMEWIGIYIAMASFFCISAMTADLFHGFRKRKIWFPSKYFSLNAASITVIAVTMKLPMDLSSPMPGVVDQVTKLGSMAFMCTMMANLMPSLASMGNKSLIANVTGFAIFVITMIVNICIEINTGIIINHEDDNNFFGTPTISNVKFQFMKVACTYVAMILLLLIIMISSSITIPTFKHILELKYRAIRRTTLNDQHPQHTTLEKLRQHVRRHWVMVKTSSPQFVMANNPLSFASAIICVISIVTNISLFWKISQNEVYVGCKSDYKLSILAIYITQFIGVIVGGITPILRCFTVLSLQLFAKSTRNYLMDFTVEKYWTKKLCEWKEIQIPFLSNGRRSRTLVHKTKTLILSLCIEFQKIIIVLCKMLRLIPVVVLIFVVCCLKLFSAPIASKSDVTKEEDLDPYVLQLEDEIRLGDKTLEGISKSMDRLIQKVEKEEHKDLLKLIEKSTGFNGVANFDMDQVQRLISIELPNTWSLPIVTLTCIAIALPNIQKDTMNSLFKSVGEGLLNTHLIEESLNSANEYVNIQKASMSLWHEVQGNRKWLENTLERSAYNGKTPWEIVEWFADKAKEIVIEMKRNTNEVVENFPTKLIAANSMYRISQTLLHNYRSNIELNTTEQLFALLNGMIADIVAACLTNIPRVIKLKCDESVIEKRESSVEAAAKLFGRTMKVINRLEAYKLPSMDHDRMAFIDDWRLHLQQSIP